VFAALWTAFGFVYGPESVVGQLALYAATPPDRLAHVFSAVNATQSAATLIGFAVTAGLIDLIGVRTSIVTAGILFALASLVCFGLASGGRQLRQLTI
jgi:MFS family permease